MGYQLELRHFKYFQALANELNYRKASEKLFISQPGLSRQIKQMEEILKVPLFIRTKRKVDLTEAGKYLKSEVDFILNHLQLTAKQLKMINDGQMGEVRIGFLGSAVQKVIPDLMLKLNTHYPEVHTSLEELSNRAQIEGLQKDALDIGFVRMARVPKEMEMHPVHTDGFSVALPKEHPLTARNFKNMGQLKDEPFILFSSDYSPLYYDKIMSICEDQGFSPRISHKSVNAHTIFKLVESGLGVAIIPSSLHQGFDLDVKFIKLKDVPQNTVLSAVWRSDNRNPATRKVIDLLLK